MAGAFTAIATFLYSKTWKKILDGTVNIDTTADLRILLVHDGGNPGTIAADHPALLTTAEFLADFDLAASNAYEYPAVTGYARKVLASKTSTVDTVGNEVELDAADITYTSLASIGLANHKVIGALLYIHITDDSQSVPVQYFDLSTKAFDGNGGNVTLVLPTEGYLKLRNP